MFCLLDQQVVFQLDVELSSSKVRVGSRVGVTLHANPKSLLGLHIFDSCLDELFTKTTGIRNNVRQDKEH